MRVLKYRLEVSHLPQHLPLPADAKILMVGEQHGYPHMWVQVPERLGGAYVPENKFNPADSQLLERRTFYTVATGEPIPDTLTYVGSAICNGGNFVWHVYEVK